MEEDKPYVFDYDPNDNSLEVGYDSEVVILSWHAAQVGTDGCIAFDFDYIDMSGNNPGDHETIFIDKEACVNMSRVRAAIAMARRTNGLMMKDGVVSENEGIAKLWGELGVPCYVVPPDVNTCDKFTSWQSHWAEE